MAKARKRTDVIRAFLLESTPDHSRDLVAFACDRFGLSRQAINRHVKSLVEEGLLVASGATRRREYKLAKLVSSKFTIEIPGLSEDTLWRERIAPLLRDLPENARDIWQYGFTEMVNNAIDHSGGATLRISVSKTAIGTSMLLMDDGVGIFRKIKSAMNLEDERHAVLELAKGKLTTDPSNHTGEGIFFSSRMFDEYVIVSGEVVFSHEVQDEEDWIFERETPNTGTTVYMSTSDATKITSKSIFDKFSTKDGHYGFNRTVVPVKLLKHGPEKLVSRSQAKRLLARFDRFRVIVLDFSGVEAIGQAFADEIFRVFVAQNPKLKIIPINESLEVKRMIKRARKHE